MDQAKYLQIIALQSKLSIKQNMVTCSVQSWSNQSKLNNKGLLLENTRLGEKICKGCLDKGKWLPKAIHICFVRFTEDHFNESQEMKIRLF